MKYNNQNPNRYVVIHSYFWNGVKEEAQVSYSTKLDNIQGMVSAQSMATHTASRYAGEIFAGFETADGPVLVPVKSYRR